MIWLSKLYILKGEMIAKFVYTPTTSKTFMWRKLDFSFFLVENLKASIDRDDKLQKIIAFWKMLTECNEFLLGTIFSWVNVSRLSMAASELLQEHWSQNCCNPKVIAGELVWKNCTVTSSGDRHSNSTMTITRAANWLKGDVLI